MAVKFACSKSVLWKCIFRVVDALLEWNTQRKIIAWLAGQSADEVEGAFQGRSPFPGTECSQKTTLPLKASRKEQRSVIHFLWAKRRCPNTINKLQNGAIPSILNVGKIRNIRFVGNLILHTQIIFFHDDVIMVTSFVHRTQSICVLFSPQVSYHNSQVINSINEKETNKLKKLM